VGGEKGGEGKAAVTANRTSALCTVEPLAKKSQTGPFLLTNWRKKERKKKQARSWQNSGCFARGKDKQKFAGLHANLLDEKGGGRPSIRDSNPNGRLSNRRLGRKGWNKSPRGQKRRKRENSISPSSRIIPRTKFVYCGRRVAGRRKRKGRTSEVTLIRRRKFREEKGNKIFATDHRHFDVRLQRKEEEREKQPSAAQ